VFVLFVCRSFVVCVRMATYVENAKHVVGILYCAFTLTVKMKLLCSLASLVSAAFVFSWYNLPHKVLLIVEI
jgi:hypothetical protein